MSKVETVKKLPTAPQPSLPKLRKETFTNPIKPCPFCGNKEVELVSESHGMHFELGTGYIVRCNFMKGGCGARSGSRTTKEEALNAWNERR